ncbi:PREDICTED: nmrA-like family domain-containing protein 1 [Branchiostoma belcheri]|uniref:NmrA-like family domain-containing protein 1 n=1 Tax=Branchiostoma belcheri TaxID=7741 RepID=A0A6P4YJU0_BRABE|nr:PREDICTED: nmrA-like family domain-containing protein 1 [Branchiostoma belcheri]
MAKVVTVFGATGTQGGGVANALLEDPEFKVRIVTRSASSDKAKALQERGAEVIEGNFDDASSLERALQGAHGTFVMTQHSFEVPDSDQLEIKQLEDGTYELSLSKWRVDCCLGLTSPDFAMEGAAEHGVSVTDSGFAVRAIFQNRAEWLGRTVGFSAEKLTIQQHADILSKHLAPRVFKSTKMTSDAFSKLPFPGAKHLGDMFKFLRLGNPDYSPELTRQLYPGTRGLDQWVADNREALLNALSNSTT